MQFKVGDWVQWTSQAAGITRTKVGEVTHIIPPGQRPSNVVGCGSGRDHESYVVLAYLKEKLAGVNLSRKRRSYWPAVSGLRVADPVYKDAASGPAHAPGHE